MSAPSGILVTLPGADDEVIFWWEMAEGGVRARGEDIDPLAAAGRDAPQVDARIVALAPAARSVVRRHRFEGLPPAQAEAAARLEAIDRSIGGSDGVHVSARALADAEDGAVLTAAIDPGTLAAGLAILQQRGLDPDRVVPASLVPPAPENGIAQAVVGGEPVLRGADFAAIDEPHLRAALVGDTPPERIAGEALDAALWAAFADPPIDLRSGPFRKRRTRLAITATQIRRLATLAGLVLLGSLLIGLVQLTKYSLGADAQDRRALAAAQRVVPGVADLDGAEAALRAELAARGRGALVFTVPSAALYAALRQAPNVTLRQLSYERGGLLSASLSAPTPEDINAVLVAIQRDGYVITANARQEANGETWADITVRTP